MKMATEQEALDLLAALHIQYRRVDHPAIWTMDDPNTPPGLPEVKNLLLKKKKSDQFYLYLTDNERVDFKMLADELEISRSRLTFASEDELEQLLGVVSGMVTPLALMHDAKHEVQVVLNRRLEKLPEISMHPNVNTATILVSWGDLLRVIEGTGHEALIA